MNIDKIMELVKWADIEMASHPDFEDSETEAAMRMLQIVREKLFEAVEDDTSMTCPVCQRGITLRKGKLVRIVP